MKSIESLLIKTHKAAAVLRNATDAQIKKLLISLADAVEKNSAVIIKANKKDVAKQDANDPKVDRLILNEQRIKNIVAAFDINLDNQDWYSLYNSSKGSSQF